MKHSNTALSSQTRTDLLGPFIGHTTDTSITIWLRIRNGSPAHVELQLNGSAVGERKRMEFLSDALWAGSVTFDKDLNADTRYEYRFYTTETGSELVDLYGIDERDMYVRTFPSYESSKDYRLDFLLLSCNNPDASVDKKKKKDGYELWQTLPSVLNNHLVAEGNESRVRFALMGGDQIYADDWKDELLDKEISETPSKNATPKKSKIEIYLEIYEHYWSDLRYRRVLASLPAYLMWDDHDIIDGWGSEESSFQLGKDGRPTGAFQPNWGSMFVSAKKAFKFYQSGRNAPQLLTSTAAGDETFDTAFRVGRSGFVLADLRSNRNWSKRQFWTPAQFDATKFWIEQNRNDIDVLFFLTPVVFAHGAPLIEESVLKYWGLVLTFFKHARETQRKITLPLVILYRALMTGALVGLAYLFASLQTWVVAAVSIAAPVAMFIGLRKFRNKTSIERAEIVSNFKLGRYNWRPIGILLHLIGIWTWSSIINWFDKTLGDLSDDIRDSWGAPENESLAEEMLDYLFDLQNRTDGSKVNSVILTGDIHTGGVSEIFSSKTRHSRRCSIPQIVSSPIGYSPFPWIAEAIYRSYSVGKIQVGKSGHFYAQVSHHFTERNFVIASVEASKTSKIQLRAKFYVEGFPEPQTATFILDHRSAAEQIPWPTR